MLLFQSALLCAKTNFSINEKRKFIFTGERSALKLISIRYNCNGSWRNVNKIRLLWPCTYDLYIVFRQKSTGHPFPPEVGVFSAVSVIWNILRLGVALEGLRTVGCSLPVKGKLSFVRE